MRYQLFAAGILVVACSGRPANAQTTNAIAPPQTTPAESSGEGGRGEQAMMRFLERVPEETRQRFLAARDAAVGEHRVDDAVQRYLRREAGGNALALQVRERLDGRVLAHEDAGNRSWLG